MSNSTSMDGVAGQMLDKLDHVFNHVTATHENLLRRCDRLESRLSAMQAELDSARGPVGLNGLSMPILASTGIGRFRGPISDGDAEAQNFVSALEIARLLRAAKGP